MRKNYYEILGVNKNASDVEIKKAFRIKAKQYHPDYNKEANANEHFKVIFDAYSVLSDDKKRLEYDRYLTGQVRNSKFVSKDGIYIIRAFYIQIHIMKLSFSSSRSFSNFCDSLNNEIFSLLINRKLSNDTIDKIIVNIKTMEYNAQSPIAVCNMIAQQLGVEEYNTSIQKFKNRIKKILKK